MAELSRCEFCRISFNNFKNHIYSDKHKRKVLAVLKKFKFKVKQAKVLQKAPEVEASDFESSHTFWCHFCNEEYEKHIHLQTATVKCGGFLRHLSDVSHAEKVKAFWVSQRIRDHKTESYTMSEDKFTEFEKRALLKVEEFTKKNEDEFAKKLAALKEIEERRQKQLMETVEPLHPDRISQVPSQSIKPQTEGQIQRGYRTVAAKGEGLTCIQLSTSPTSFQGNIYTGAPPPWMAEEGPPKQNNSVIGPTQADLTKHVEEEKRRKLPSQRVGATVEAYHGGDWMPAFGRVWSKQSRQQQRKWPFKGSSTKPYAKKVVTLPQNQTVGINQSESTEANRAGGQTSNTSTGHPYERQTQGQSMNFQEKVSDRVDWNHSGLSEQNGLHGTHSTSVDMQRYNMQGFENPNGNGLPSMDDLRSAQNGHESLTNGLGNCRPTFSLVREDRVARPYVRKKHGNNVGLGKIDINPNLL